MTEHRKLLADYATNGSEEAFRELTACYVNLVYATAVRLLDGDTHRAEDVVQTVFGDLGRLAATLSSDVMLGGWLHRRACHVAANVIRSDRRRQNRERQAAEMNALQGPADQNLDRIASALDEAINHLNASDRASIVLRYFEGRDLRSIGAAMGTSEDAAQKRVSRALEKLRVLLMRRGITASVVGLGSVLSAQSAVIAPLGLATSVSTAALAGASAQAGMTLSLLKLTAMTKIKVAAGVAVAAALGTIFIIEHQRWSTLSQERQALQQQLVKFNEQTSDAEAASNPSARAITLNPQQLGELEKLRREIGALGQQASELARLRAENGRLFAASAGNESADPAKAEFDQETRHRIHNIKKWGLMFRMYAGEKGGQFPDSWDKVTEQIPATERAAFLKFAKDNFEITYRGTEQGLSNRWDVILFQEKQPRRSPTDTRVKIYGFVDGSASTLNEPGASFDTFEKQHIIAPK